MIDTTENEDLKNAEVASATVWRWKDSGLGSAAPSKSAIQKQGIIKACIAIAVGCLFWFFGLPRIMSYIALLMGAIVMFAAIFSPYKLLATLDRGGARLGIIVSRILQWILLPVIYYLFFLPFGKIFRKGKKDVLKRFYEPESDSYWIKRNQNLLAKGSRSKQF